MIQSRGGANRACREPRIQDAQVSAHSVNPTLVSSGSVVLPDVAVRFLEKLLVTVELVLQQRAPQRLLDRALTFVGVLPLGEPDLLDDVINVANNTFHDDGCVFVAGPLE